MDTSGIAIFERVCALDLEGIVAKYKFDKYEEDRKRSTWFKIRNRKYSQMVDRASCSSEIVTVSQSPGGIPAKLPVVRRRFDLLPQRAERFGHCASPLFSNVAVTFTTQPGFISTFEVQSLEPARFNSSTGALSAPTPMQGPSQSFGFNRDCNHLPNAAGTGFTRRMPHPSTVGAHGSFGAAISEIECVLFTPQLLRPGR